MIVRILIYLPVCCLGVLGGAANQALAQGVTGGEEWGTYRDLYYGKESGAEKWIQSISVHRPHLRSSIRGDVVVELEAPGMNEVVAYCWRQPTPDHPNPWGHGEVVAKVALGDRGTGRFHFPADEYPHGPTNLQLFARGDEGRWDIFELQLYNLGGIPWNEGIPDAAPPAAKGMELVFADDFEGALSISKDGRGARYNAHKPRFGDFSGWPFSDPSGPQNPFAQVDTYLRIMARKPEGTRGFTGLIASVDMDGNGFRAKAPCYLECRLTAQSAPGTWPAFWTITHLDRGPGDELDIIEAYGGVGPGNPNHPGYSIVSHFWHQTNPDGSPKEGYSTRVPMLNLGGKSYWSTTFHTYGVRIGRNETIYYFDNIEVLRHPTNGVSRDNPHCFLVNYAIGGISGWPINLKRFGNGSDMYVDFIRVYRGDAAAASSSGSR